MKEMSYAKYCLLAIFAIPSIILLTILMIIIDKAEKFIKGMGIVIKPANYIK